MFLTDIMSAQVKVKELSVGSVLFALSVFSLWAFNEIKEVKEIKPDTRLVAIETSLSEMNKKIDRMDNQTQARFDRLEAKMDKLLER